MKKGKDMHQMNKLLLLCFVSVSVHADEINIVSLYDLMKTDPTIQYIKCHDAIPFEYKQFPLSICPSLQSSKGLFAETFILKIPQGKVCSKLGFVNISDKIVLEFFSQNIRIEDYEVLIQNSNMSERIPRKISGKVAVITRIGTECYGHWIGEILGRLLLLVEQGVEFDWLYVPCDKRYIQETLDLLGIDRNKIIEPHDDTFYIQADELIVPSLTIRRIPETDGSDFYPSNRLTMYVPHWNITLLRDRFLPLMQQNIIRQDFSEKVFISRRNAGMRRMINEDDVFLLFEKKGFKRYFLEELSFLEQVMLFNQATIIVGAHGSGLTNVIFCNTDAHIVEIFQHQFDSTFWNLSQVVGLKHDYIKTYEYHCNEFMDIDTEVPISIIEKYINNNL